MRLVASRIAQLRLMHILLNAYLKRIWRVDNARCPVCGEDEENTKHFLLRCPSYAHERWTLTQPGRSAKPSCYKYCWATLNLSYL